MAQRKKEIRQKKLLERAQKRKQAGEGDDDKNEEKIEVEELSPVKLNSNSNGLPNPMQQQKNKPVGVREESDVNNKEEPFPELMDPFAENRSDDGNLEGNLEYTDQVIQQLRSGVSENNFEDPELAAAIAASLEMM